MDQITSLEELRRSFEGHGFSSAHVAQLATLARPCLRYAATQAEDAEIALGASKLAGLPDLPRHADWPVGPPRAEVASMVSDIERRLEVFDGRTTGELPYDFDEHRAYALRHLVSRYTKGVPLHFIGQLNFAEAWAVDPGLADYFPRDGVLSLFYDVENAPWGYAPEHRLGSRVLYSPAKGLERRALPKGIQGLIDADRDRKRSEYLEKLKEGQPQPGLVSRFLGKTRTAPDPSVVDFPNFEPYLPQPHALKGRAGLTMPDYQTILGHIPNLPARFATDEDAGQDLALDHWFEACHHDKYSSQLGGIAYAVQNHGMAEEAEYVSNQRFTVNGERLFGKSAEALKAGAADWVLLAQFASDDGVWMWGDAGMLYVWIRKQDLAARAFDKTWVILQSH